ncbi:MAG TPA: hypothetical protein VFY86_14940 [Nocardioides sp.]|nr:hypothetical protein [Nocardioides sp.]
MFELLTMLAGVLVFPWLCLAFLLWMSWLEDSLPAAVRRTGRTPDPEPILAIPVEHAPAEPVPAEPVSAQPVTLPDQREPVQTSLVARSAEASLGGSTNR